MHTYMVRIEALKLIHFKILPNSELECGCVIWLPKSLPSVARYPQKVANYHRSAALGETLTFTLEGIAEKIVLHPVPFTEYYENATE